MAQEQQQDKAGKRKSPEREKEEDAEQAPRLTQDAETTEEAKKRCVKELFDRTILNLYGNLVNRNFVEHPIDGDSGKEVLSFSFREAAHILVEVAYPEMAARNPDAYLTLYPPGQRNEADNKQFQEVASAAGYTFEDTSAN